MPLIKLETNVKADSAGKERLALELSRACAQCTGKPEIYVASMIEDDWTIAFAGAVKKSAFVEVRGIGGLSPAVNKKLSAAVCEILDRELGIAHEHVYLNFIDVAASDWGWKSSTFGG